MVIINLINKQPIKLKLTEDESLTDQSVDSKILQWMIFIVRAVFEKPILYK